MALADFLDRLGTGLGQIPAQGWFQLAQGLTGTPNFAKGLAGGLGALGQTVEEDRKHKALAAALKGALPNLTPQAQGIFDTISQDNPDQALQLAASQLFDPMTQFKANYWRNLQSGGQPQQEPQATAAPQPAPQPSGAPPTLQPTQTPGFTGSGLNLPGSPGLKVPGRTVAPSATDFQSAADQAARAAGVPPEIYRSLIQTESGWKQTGPDGKPLASPKGALGLAQLMPGTAQELGVDPNDPAQNLMGGAKYLRKMYDQFGNWNDALRAYNAGPANAKMSPGISTDYAKTILARTQQGAAPQKPSAATPQGATQESELRLAQEAGMAGDDAGKSYHLNRANQLANQDIAASVLDPTYVQKMAKYEVPLPSQSRNPALYAEAVRQISQMNPKFNAAYFDEIHRARNDFQTGKDGATLQAVNNATQHLDLLAQASKAYERHDMPLLNMIQSEWLTQTGSPLPGNLEGIAATAALESAKALLPGGGGEAERQAFEKRFSSALAENQLSGKIDGQIGLMQGQINSLRLKYNKATKGTLDDFDEYILPEAQQAFDRIKQQGGGAGGPPPNGPPAAAVAQLKANPSTRAQFDQIFGPGAAAKVLGQ